MTIKGSFASLFLQDQGGNPLQGTRSLSRTCFITAQASEIQYLKITNNAWTEAQHPVRVVILDQLRKRPMFDIQQRQSIRIPIQGAYTSQMIVVAVYPICKREAYNSTAELIIRYRGQIKFETEGGAGVATNGWVPLGVDPELFTFMYEIRSQGPVKN